MPDNPDSDRYIARPLDAGGWCVWDTELAGPVFGADILPEDKAREVARRLSQANRPGPASTT
jgi:hypothetical protein